MLIVIAPDSYKGSLSALGVASAMQKGVLQVFPQATVDLIPIADGGEGTVDALVAATGGTVRNAEATDPLGRPVAACWGMLGDGKTAVLEMAAASGLPLLTQEERNAMTACSFGTGQLVKAALNAGAETIILGIGGSATNDGGAGFARALGARFLDACDKELPPGGGALANLERIDLSNLDPRLATTHFRIACDVDNPLCGPRGASAVFGPQKGATADHVNQLDDALARFAAKAAEATGNIDAATTPGAGAAGGLGAALLYFANATLMPGVSLVLQAVMFDERVRNASLVLTGEGRTDFQTAYGKAPVGVAMAAKKYGIPVVCLSGGLGQGARDVYTHGIDAVCSIAPGPISLDDCIAHSERLLEEAAETVCRLSALTIRQS